jgi:hypothetical protein
MRRDELEFFAAFDALPEDARFGARAAAARLATVAIHAAAVLAEQT